MPNASATGSLIVAAPSGSYGTGTPQTALTQAFGAITNSAAGAALLLSPLTIQPNQPFSMMASICPIPSSPIRIFSINLTASLFIYADNAWANQASCTGILYVHRTSQNISPPIYGYTNPYPQSNAQPSDVIFAAQISVNMNAQTSQANYGDSSINESINFQEGLLLSHGKGLGLSFFRILTSVPTPSMCAAAVVSYDIP